MNYRIVDSEIFLFSKSSPVIKLCLHDTVLESQRTFGIRYSVQKGKPEPEICFWNDLSLGPRSEYLSWRPMSKWSDELTKVLTHLLIQHPVTRGCMTEFGFPQNNWQPSDG